MEKKIKYLDITISNGILFNNRTREEAGTHLELYYKISDNNNYYFDKPEFEHYTDFDIISNENGSKMPLYNYLLKEGIINNTKYMLVSTHSKILDVYDFQVHINNNYFSIPINIEVSSFMEDVGLDNFKIIPKLYNITLLNLSIYTGLSGWESLFFITSDKPSIRMVLNEMRYDVLKRTINTFSNNRLLNGFYINTQNGITKVRCDSYTREKLYDWNQNPTESLPLKQVTLVGKNIISSCLQKLVDLYETTKQYEDYYLTEISKIFAEDKYEQCIESKDKNILTYGILFNKAIPEVCTNSVGYFKYNDKYPYILSAPFGYNGLNLIPITKFNICDDLTILIRNGHTVDNNPHILFWDYSNLISTLKNVRTKRVIVIDGNNSLILKDLDDDFLKLADSIKMNNNLLFAGSIINMDENMSLNTCGDGWSNQLNYSLVYGDVESMVQFYTEFISNMTMSESVAANYMSALQNCMLSYSVDSYNHLFFTIWDNIHRIYEWDNIINCKETEIYINNMLINYGVVTCTK